VPLGAIDVDALALGDTAKELVHVEALGPAGALSYGASSGGSSSPRSRASPAAIRCASVSTVARVARSACSRPIPSPCCTMVRN
jgi:hypothetical protein